MPGKVLASIGSQSVLAHCVERLQSRSGLPVIVATTIGPEDDRIELEAERLGATVFRGPADDVLTRYLLVARRWRLTALVRATADNPAVDLEAPRRTLDLLSRTGADHLVEFGLPHGAAVEAVSVEALERTAALAEDALDREHVTTLMRRDPQFLALPALAPAEVRAPELRLTIDTAGDLAFMRQVFACAGETPGAPVSLTQLIAAARRVRAMRLAPAASDGR